MIKHIYIVSKLPQTGKRHIWIMLCGAAITEGGQYPLAVYERNEPGFVNTWCSKCEERADLAILSETDLDGTETENNLWEENIEYNPIDVLSKLKVTEYLPITYRTKQ